MALYTAKKHTWDYNETDIPHWRLYEQTNYALNVGQNEPFGICWDGTFFYVSEGSGGGAGIIYKYNAAWVFQASFDISATNPFPFGITWDGTFFYAVRGNDVYKYNAAWVWQSTHSLHVDNDFACGLCWDGTCFYILDANEDYVYKYNNAWVFQEAIDISAITPVGPDVGIEWDGTYFYIQENERIVRYDSNWVLQSGYYWIIDSVPFACGLCTNGTYFYVVDKGDDTVGEFDLDTIAKTIGQHNDVTILYDGMLTSFAAAHMTGNIEYYLRALDANDKVEILLKDDAGNICIRVKIDTDKIIGDGSDALDPALDHTWYLIRVDFDCTPNTYDLYVDGVLQLNDQAFGVNDNGTGLYHLEVSVNTNKGGYIDAIGYDWDPNYSQGDNLDDTVDITADISECKITEEMGVPSIADLKVKGSTISEFEAGHEVDFYDSDDVLSWTGRILYPEAVTEGTQIVGKLKLLGLDSQFNNTYRKNFTTVRDSDYIIKNIIDNALTRYHSYDDEIDNFTTTYKYDLKTKIQKLYNYLAMLERAVIHPKPDGEIIFNKYNNLTASGMSWDQTTSYVRITSYTPAANRRVTRAPVIGANNDLGQVYYVGTATESEEDRFGINELQAWRDSEITNYTEAKQLGDNLQIVYSLDTQMITLFVVQKKHIQVGYTVELAWTGVFNITKKDFLVTKRVWYPINDMCEINLTDNILTRSAFNVRVINKFYDEDAQQSFEESDVSESTVDGTVETLHSVASLRSPTYLNIVIGNKITVELADGESIDVRIDTLIATHTAISAAHHARYTDAEVQALSINALSEDGAPALSAALHCNHHYMYACNGLRETVGNNIFFYPDGQTSYYLRVNRSSSTIYLYGTNNWYLDGNNTIYIRADATIQLYPNHATGHAVNLTSAEFYNTTSKSIDMGKNGTPWDEAYCDNYVNQGPKYIDPVGLWNRYLNMKLQPHPSKKTSVGDTEIDCSELLDEIIQPDRYTKQYDRKFVGEVARILKRTPKEVKDFCKTKYKTKDGCPDDLKDRWRKTPEDMNKDDYGASLNQWILVNSIIIKQLMIKVEELEKKLEVK